MTETAAVTRSDWGEVERTGFIASIASIGGAFDPGMFPRTVKDQTIAVAVISSVNYGVVATSQTVLHALARTIWPAADPGADLRAGYSSNLAGAAIGAAAWAGVGPSKQSTVGRQLGRRICRSSIIGLVSTAAADLGRRTGGRLPAALLPSGRIAATLIGAGIAAGAVHRRTRPPGEQPPDPAQITRSLLLGGALSAALITVGKLEDVAADRIQTLLRRAAPPGPAGRALAAAGGRLVVLWATAEIARTYIHRAALKSQQANALPAHDAPEPPHSGAVSGGPASAVPFDTLSVEGAKFVLDTSTANEIGGTTGTPAQDPIRVYIGLDSAANPEDRAALAFNELENFGAFERAFLCLAVPAGTGYVNPVAIGALEHLTAGNCATVALQYSQRRSFYSLGRVPLGADQNRLLLAAITERLSSMPADKRPTLVLYGESLGALAAQTTFDTDGPDALHRLGLDYALFPGTPRGSAWARRWRAQPTDIDPHSHIAEIASHQEWLELPADRQDNTKIVLLTHHDDPVPVFGRSLIIHPTAAAPNAAASTTTAFRPLTTFVLTAIDLNNAMSGDHTAFTTIGHDYRGDLVRFVSLAYRLPADEKTITNIETGLTRKLLDTQIN